MLWDFLITIFEVSVKRSKDQITPTCEKSFLCIQNPVPQCTTVGSFQLFWEKTLKYSGIHKNPYLGTTSLLSSIVILPSFCPSAAMSKYTRGKGEALRVNQNCTWLANFIKVPNITAYLGWEMPGASCGAISPWPKQDRPKSRRFRRDYSAKDWGHCL